MKALSRKEKLACMYACDKSVDGLFITGVLTTGIYCLPSCPARKPKAENVRFFGTEHDAQAAGLRACKRCRPDYFYARFDPDYEMYLVMIKTIKEHVANLESVAELAAKTGLSVSKLYELIKRYEQTTPAELIHKQRIVLAQQMLHHQHHSIIETAYATGYNSLSAFYARFKHFTGITPRAFQKNMQSN